MGKLWEYGSLVKIEHTLFSFPLILSGVFIGLEGVPGLGLLLLIALAGFGARTAALGLNRLIDREIDRRNPRTRERELPSGRLTALEGGFVVVVGLAVYLLSAYYICDLVLYLSPIPLVVFVVYPYLKRFTAFCHFGVGAGLALAPLGGFLAATCSLGDLLPPLLLTLFTLCWVTGFDIIYSTLDEEFDRSQGLHSLVVRYGRRSALSLSAALHALGFIFLAALYLFLFRSVLSLIVLLVTGYLLYWEQRRASDVDLAFFRLNVAVGFLVFLFVLSGIYLG